MASTTRPILIRHAKVWDGSGQPSFDADVLIEGERIARVFRGGAGQSAGGADTIDAAGRTLMPGLVEGHSHITFTGVNANAELGPIPPEEHLLLAARNARTMLEQGFTSLFSAASAKLRLDVVVRNAIDSGMLTGPRMRAASPEITVTGGLGDERRIHLYQEGFGLVVDGPVAMREAVRTCVREGVDTIKLNISGDEFVAHARGEVTTLCDDELAEAMSIARRFGKTTAAHARASQSVLMAVKHGVDCIYHCDFADEEALDALESVKDRVFVGPAFGLVHNMVYEGEAAGIPKATLEKMGMQRKLDRCIATYQEIRKRGIRVVIGGDYGFGITPFGTNARDIAHFVRFFGYSPGEALQCATRIGAELMGLGGQAGEVRDGLLADLLLVDGDPLADPGVLQHRDRLVMVMLGGRLFRDPRGGGSDSGLIR